MLNMLRLTPSVGHAASVDSLHKTFEWSSINHISVFLSVLVFSVGLLVSIHHYSIQTGHDYARVEYENPPNPIRYETTAGTTM